MKKTLFPAITALILLLALVVGVGKFVFQTNPSSDINATDGKSSVDVSQNASPALRGRVITPQGNGISNAQIKLLDGTNLIKESTSDAQGYFQFQVVESGNYELVATAEGYILPELSQARRKPVAISNTQASNSPASSKILHLIMQQPGSIRGKVVANNQPVKDASLSLYYLFSEGIAGNSLEPFVQDIGLRSSEDGSFELLNIAPGRLRIFVQANDYAFAESQEIYLRGGDTRDEIIIALTQGSVLRGSVVSVEGDPLRASVTLRGPALRNGESQTTDRQGNYSFESIPGGIYSLEVHAQGYRTQTLARIQLEEGDIQTHDILLEQASGLFGQVIDSQSRGVPNALVVFRSGSERKEVRTHADGTFHWEDIPEDATRRRWTAQAITTRHTPSQPLPIEFGSELVIQLNDGAHIHGRVVNDRGEPVANFVVAVESMVADDMMVPLGYSPRAISPAYIQDSDGDFSFGPLRPGTYQLRVYASEYAPGISESITLRAGRDATGVVVRLGQGATLSGIVRSATTGNPISGAQVTLFEPSSAHPPKSTRTDHAGRYFLNGVPAGRRSLRINHTDYLTELAAGIDIPRSGTITRDISLSERKKGERFSFHGIGAVLGQNEKGVEIGQVNENGPADLFGLQTGDVILAIDGMPTRGHNLTNIVERIRGEEGSSVQLQIDRQGEGRFTVAVERGRVVVKDPTN